MQNRDFPGSPVVGTSPSNVGGAGSIPGRGAGIPHASWPRDQDIEQKQCCDKFNKDFGNGPHQKQLKKKKKDSEQLPHPPKFSHAAPLESILPSVSTIGNHCINI